MKCPDDPSGCHLFGCRYHNLRQPAAFAARTTDAAKRRHRERVLLQDYHRLPAMCSLEIASEGPHTMEEVGNILDMTKERVRQIEVRALYKIRHRALYGKQNELAEFAEHSQLASHLERKLADVEAKLENNQHKNGRSRLELELNALTVAKKAAQRKGLI